MELRAKWPFMDWDVTHKLVYGPQLRFGPYNILWVTSQSISCHMTLSAMNYLLNIMATSFSGGRSRSTPERTIDHGQATGKLYHLRLQVECTLFGNLKSRA
jgi:hypothetical protein